MKLIQQHLLKGRREFEIIDDRVEVRSKSPFREEERITVMLTVLNPEPTITRAGLHFTSRVNGEPLLSLYLGKPDVAGFNAFVAQLKQRAMEEYQRFAGLKPLSQALGGNVYDEPPIFDETAQQQARRATKPLDAARIDEAIRMLKTYLPDESIMPLLLALDALKADPANQTGRLAVANTFNQLDSAQGAVLTYAPYLSVILADEAFRG